MYQTSSVIIGALSMVSLIGLGGDVGLALGLTWKPLDSLAGLWGDTLAGKLRVLVHCDKPRTIFKVKDTKVTRAIGIIRIRRWYHSVSRLVKEGHGRRRFLFKSRPDRSEWFALLTRDPSREKSRDLTVIRLSRSWHSTGSCLPVQYPCTIRLRGQ